jgi:hypothetical protein
VNTEQLSQVFARGAPAFGGVVVCSTLNSPLSDLCHSRTNEVPHVLKTEISGFEAITPFATRNGVSSAISIAAVNPVKSDARTVGREAAVSAWFVKKFAVFLKRQIPTNIAPFGNALCQRQPTRWILAAFRRALSLASFTASVEVAVSLVPAKFFRSVLSFAYAALHEKPPFTCHQQQGFLYKVPRALSIGT